jgi:hypothetical protein
MIEEHPKVKSNNNKITNLASIDFIKMCQNTPQLCWGDEWPTLSPGWERVRVRGK